MVSCLRRSVLRPSCEIGEGLCAEVEGMWVVALFGKSVDRL